MIFFKKHNTFDFLFTADDKTLLVKPDSTNELLSPSPIIVIHIHVFYLDVFKEYIDIFDKWTIEYHLFITTDTLEKKKAIGEFLQNHAASKILEEIIVFPNRGRDILPWLSIAERLNKYDIVGHFHTKKSPHIDQDLDVSWQQELLDLLLRPINSLINVFMSDEKIGVVIPDIPHCLQLHPVFDPYGKRLRRKMNKLWEEMRCKEKIDFRNLSMLIFPYGNMFWYRPAALRPLFELLISNIKIPKEPLAVNNTILHWIERMPVYIAWSEGFDYRVSTYSVPLKNAFQNNLILNYQRGFINSREYKIGRLALMIPRFIKRCLKRILHK